MTVSTPHGKAPPLPPMAAGEPNLTAARDALPWVQLADGSPWSLFTDPRNTVDWHTLAHGLGNLCRFNGHCRPFYSVAEHCWRVGQAVDPEHRLAALLHDAHEAILGDITAPVKAALQHLNCRHGLDQLEDTADAQIHAAAGLPWPLPAATRAAVKRADLVLLATEKRDLMVTPRRPWAALPAPLPMTIKPLLPSQAATRWLGALRDWLPEAI